MNRTYITLIAALSTLSAVLCACTAFAGNTNDMINRERLHREIMVKEFIKKNGFFKQYESFEAYKKVKQEAKKYQVVIQNIKNQHMDRLKAKGVIKKAPQAIVFVSFSMPDLSLKQIIQDAARYKIPVIIRGLYENSFRKTMEKIFDLVKENNKGGISINPVWFKKYDIKVVPALVVSNDSGNNIESGGSEIDVVYGNIPLKRALMIVAERGDEAKIAEDILSRSRT